MTVQYNKDVLTGGPVVFLRLLMRWKGCVIKLIYVDFIVFILLYSIISCVYRFALSATQQRAFEQVILYVNNFQSMIPISFILGFYVQLVFNRFWQQFNTIPWVFGCALAIVGTIPGSGQARLIRRTCIRYLNASLIIASSRLHITARRRFPTIQHLVYAGVLNQRECDLIEGTELVAAQPFLPIVWTTAIIMRADSNGFIKNQHALVNLLQCVNTFREQMLKLFLMDKVCVPLVYTQVVTLAVYLYFLSSIIGHQYIIGASPNVKKFERDYYFPFYNVLEFIVYMGWLKVAETLVNPMGEDDEDFDINAIINCNWGYAMHLVDRDQSPMNLTRDRFWDSAVTLPHTKESSKLQSTEILGSAYNIDVTGADDISRSRISLKKTSSAEKDYLRMQALEQQLQAETDLSTRQRRQAHLPDLDLPISFKSTASKESQLVYDRSEKDHRDEKNVLSSVLEIDEELADSSETKDSSNGSVEDKRTEDFRIDTENEKVDEHVNNDQETSDEPKEFELPSIDFYPNSK